jgi:serine/threonine protein kinase/tetratricopeptide (TPR) repeat protein
MRAGEVIAQRFLLERIAGSGGMGEVFRARDLQRNEIVAVKLIKAGAVESAGTARDRFEREALALATLHQEGVVRYLGHGVIPSGDYWLAMEWLEGETLSEVLKRRTPSLAEGVALGVAVASALASVHARGFVHRDVKPTNVFLRNGDLARPVLIDFGVVRDDSVARALTSTGAIVGTAGYMAPEQARGVRDVTARADLFALGCVLFKCFTGRPPFLGDDMLSVLLKLLAEDPPMLRELQPEAPPELEALLARMLAKEPSRRPTSTEAAVLLAAIRLGAPALVARSIDPPTPHVGREITGIERRVVCLVLARGASNEQVTTVLARSVSDSSPPPDLEDNFSAVARRYHGQVDALSDRSLLVTFSSAGAATDLVARAVRCALSLREQRPLSPVIVVTGRSVIAGRVPVGDLIDRASALALSAAPGRVRVDDATAGLVGARFELVERDGAFDLVGDFDTLAVSRTLLGRPVPCVGREPELATLDGAFTRSIEEPCAVAVLVTAPPGIGKSRLRDEAIRRIRARVERPIVWVGQGDPMSAGSPFSLLGQALRRVIGVGDGDPSSVKQERLKAWTHALGVDEPARAAAFLGEIVGAPFPDDAHPHFAGARREPQRMFDQILRTFVEVVRAASRSGAVVLVLEDLHWGDLPTVRLVDGLLAQLTDTPLFVLALARPEVSEQFPNLWAERSMSHVRLMPLSRKASERLVRHALGEAATDEAVRHLVDRASGHAFYLEELVRAVAAGKGETLPETVLAMVQARLEDLRPEPRRVLRAASVFGPSFWRSGVQTLLGKEPVGAHLDELVAAELVTPRHASRYAEEQELVFRHALLREAAYAMLTDADRVLGHALAARWLEQVGETDALRLAEHWERGERLNAAALWYQRAAAQAHDTIDLDSAFDRAGRAIKLFGDAPEHRARVGDLYVLQSSISRHRGASAESVRTGKEALARLLRGSSAWCVAMTEVVIGSARLGDNDYAVELVSTLLAMPDAEGDSRVDAARRAMAFARAVPPMLYIDRLDLADPMLERAEAMANASGELAALAELTRVQGLRAHVTGDTGLHLSIVKKVRAYYEEMGDVRGATAYQVMTGYVTAELGGFEQAVTMLRDAIVATKRIGLRNWHTYAIENLGLVLAFLGQMEEARALEEASVLEFEAQGDRRGVAGARIYLATVLRMSGDYEAAVDVANTVLEEPTTPVPFRALTYGVLSRVRLAQGRFEAALAASEEGMRVLSGLSTIEEGEPGLRLAHADALYHAGHIEEARAFILDARDRLIERASKIADQALREGFLHRVLDHADTLARARAW